MSPFGAFCLGERSSRRATLHVMSKLVFSHLWVTSTSTLVGHHTRCNPPNEQIEYREEGRDPWGVEEGVGLCGCLSHLLWLPILCLVYTTSAVNSTVCIRVSRSSFG